MESKNVEMRIITPAFIHGANNKIELRASSIKGVMRYLYRAVKAEEDIRVLKEDEMNLFGGVNNDVAYRSKVSMKIIRENLPKIHKYNLLPHKNKPIRKAFDKNGKFSLNLTSYYKESIIEFINVLKVLSHIGSVGQRSRRGFGSIQIEKIDGVSFDAYKSKDTIMNDLIDSLNTIKENEFEISNKKIIRKKSNSKCSYPYIKEILFEETDKTEDKILKSIGQATHDFMNIEKGNRCNGSAEPRFASPTWVTIKRLRDGKYIVVITKLKSLPGEGNVLDCDKKQDEFVDLVREKI